MEINDKAELLELKNELNLLNRKFNVLMKIMMEGNNNDPLINAFEKEFGKKKKKIIKKKFFKKKIDR